MRTHYNSVHLGIRYSCDVCTRTFSTPSHKQQHMKKDHTKEELYKNVEVQTQISISDNEYLCTSCDMTFDKAHFMNYRLHIIKCNKN